MDTPTTIMFHIDAETLNDLSHANDELIQGPTLAPCAALDSLNLNDRSELAPLVNNTN